MAEHWHVARPFFLCVRPDEDVPDDWSWFLYYSLVKTNLEELGPMDVCQNGTEATKAVAIAKGHQALSAAEEKFGRDVLAGMRVVFALYAEVSNG
ncbi:MAG: hypothetical protein AAFR47_21075 [Pseudomonadota bacterium]